MKKLYFLLIAFAISYASFGQLVINEVDSDTAGTDVAEFIELKWTPNTPLDGYSVVLFNGSDDLSYIAFDLDGFSTDANGFFILANTPLVQAGDFDIGASNMIQNGADAVTILLDDAVNWPNDTPISVVNLVDVVVYGTSDPDDAGLLAAFSETTQWDEGLNGLKDTESIQRSDDGLTYDTKAPTFRAENSTPTCDLSLTTTSETCDTITVGPTSDTYTATFDFIGGGTSTYTVMADFGTVDLSGGDPSIDATGTITVTGITEGTDVTITVQDGALCDLMSTVTSPACEPTEDLPITENFDYGGAAGDLTTTSGGVWVNHSGSGAVQYATGSLTMSGYPASGVGGSATVDGALGEDVNRSFTTVTSGNIYFSALVNISTVGTGNYFFHLKDDATAFRARIGAQDDAAGGIFFGIGASSSTLTYGTTSFSLGTTYLVVGTYNIDTGVSNLYVLATPEAVEPMTPEATNTGTPGTLISSVALRQSGNIPVATIDGIQVSTNWSDLTLSTNTVETNAFKVYPNPNKTGLLNITSSNNGALKAQVFDILGKEVIQSTNVNGTLNVSQLSAGLYIVKLSQGNASVTKKLVIE